MADQATKAVIEQARELAERFPDDPQHHLVKKAFAQEWAFRQETASALDESFESLQAKMSEYDQDPADVQQAILRRMQQDQAWTTILNKEIKKINEEAKQVPHGASSHTQERPSYPVTTNKLFDILNGTRDFVEQPEFLTWLGNITSGNFEWPNYRYHTESPEVTVLGNKESDTLYGNSRGTYYKTVLLNTHIQYGNFDKMPVNPINYYIAPLPKSLITACGPSFTTSYTYYNKLDIQGLFIPYNGYAFGGARQLPVHNKPFGPEDCSSWIVKLSCSADLSIRISTRDFFLTARGETNNPFGLYNELINIRDPQDIQPGLVMSRHRFAENDHEHKKPLGGHTALVLGVKDAKQGKEIITIGYNRDMPDKEGLGIETFPFTQTQDREIFFFTPKKTASITQALETTLKP